MKKKKLYFIAIVVMLGIALYSATRGILILQDYDTARDGYAALQSLSGIQQQQQEEQKTESMDSETVDLMDFSELLAENPDCIGWIQFPNLSINYPIVQGEDNQEYLRTTFWGEPATAGCIFIDEANAPDFTDDNTFIYGHNMRDETMFGMLKYYEDEEFYRENPGFYLYTPEATYYCEIYACHRVNTRELSRELTICYESEEEYLGYIDGELDTACYETGVEVSARDRTITLLTCSREEENSRMLVHAKIPSTPPVDCISQEP